MSETLILSGADIAALMTPADYLRAVDDAFRASAEGKTYAPPPMHIHADGGGFHAKGASLKGARHVAAVKLNGNFPGNPARGLPTIQGVIVLSDAENGAVLAIMDSIEITLRRTAAATALAAQHLALPDASRVAIIGAGAQARPQLEALAGVRKLKRCRVYDIDTARAEAFAREASDIVETESVASVRDATLWSDIVVTCTTSRMPFLNLKDVIRGAFIAAIGADSSEKSEIAPHMMARVKVVTDMHSQCEVMGDLHQAIQAGEMEPHQTYAQLADIVTSANPGRTRADDTFVFDSTGTAIQDVASAAVVYERALAKGVGHRVALS